MSSPAEQLLARTHVVVRRGPYAIGAWALPQLSAIYTGLLRASRSDSFVIKDDKEVTVLIQEAHLATLPQARRLEHGWCLVTLDTVMEWDVVGVLARVTGALAQADVPVGAATAFSRDHLLVRYGRLDDAVRALEGLCAGVEVRD